MVDSNRPECPSCGSESCDKIGGPTSVMLQLDGLDVDRAGRYQCHSCSDTFLFEAALIEFAPTCKCPHCGSHNTKVVKTKKRGSTVRRYHLCFERKCLRSFKSHQKLRREDASSVPEASVPRRGLRQ